MKNRIIEDLYQENIKKLLEMNYDEDPDGYDNLYHRLPLIELTSGKLFVHIYREHPMKGILVMIGSCGKIHNHITCGFKSLSDIKKIFLYPDRNNEVQTCDGGEFSIVQAMKDFDVHGTTYFTYHPPGEFSLEFTWHFGICGKHRKNLKILAREVVTFCDNHVDP